MNLKDLSEMNVLVLGAGKTGIATVSFLQDKAKKVFLSEAKKESEIEEEQVLQLKKLKVEVELGKNSLDFIKNANLVIISPGISPFSEIVKKIDSLKIPIISDIELASYFIKKPVIAVTGTNGKTTTCSLVTHLLTNSGKSAVACGNIGKPLIEVIQSSQKFDFYVLEISSFQSFYSSTLSCDIAICLNIAPDHMDWHKSFNHYLESKKKLFLQQKENSWSVLNIGDKYIKDFNPKNNIFYFSCHENGTTLVKSMANFAFFEEEILKIKYKNEIENIINKNELKIIGLHNIENSLVSLAIGKILNLTNEEIHSALKSFQGVEHRLEFVRNMNRKEFYNDSKATNPEATIKAIEAIKNKNGKNITLILGGRDKNTELKAMIEVIKKSISKIILLGEAKERFKAELYNNGYNKELVIVNNLQEAVNCSLKSNTDVVLFSPACASFDMFKNYEERGKLFKELVNNL